MTVIDCLMDLEQIMITRQEVCPRDELQYWIELQEGLAEAITLLKQRDVRGCDLKATVAKNATTTMNK